MRNGRHIRIRLVISFLPIIIGVIAGSGTPAIASPTASADAVERELAASLTFTPRGDDLLVGLGQRTETLHGPDGQTTITGALPTVPTGGDSIAGECTTSRSTTTDGRFVAYPPVALAAEGAVGHVQYFFSLFRLESARATGRPRRDQRQFEVCSRGLGQSDAGSWVMLDTGAAQAEIHPTRVSRISWDFKTGPTPPSFTLTRGFATGSQLCGSGVVVKACVDASISASLAQNVSAELLGGFKGPYAGQNNDMWRNNVVGWWDGESVEGVKSYRSQGNIIHGLWEHPHTEATGVEPTFSIEVFASFKCTRLFGIGCGDMEPAR